MKGIIGVGVVLAMLLVVGSAQGVLLSDLLQPGATIISGDKLFSDFHGWQTTCVNPADITVAAYQNPTHQEYGLKFTSSALKLTSGGGLTAEFDFIVTPTLPGYLISDNTLTMTGSGCGVIYLSETATDAATGADLASKNNYIMAGGLTQKLIDHQVYADPTWSVHVSKYIQIDWAGGTPPGPQLTEFTQTFSQIPEPAVAGLLALGLLGVLRRR